MDTEHRLKIVGASREDPRWKKLQEPEVCLLVLLAINQKRLPLEDLEFYYPDVFSIGDKATGSILGAFIRENFGPVETKQQSRSRDGKSFAASQYFWKHKKPIREIISESGFIALAELDADNFSEES